MCHSPWNAVPGAVRDWTLWAWHKPFCLEISFGEVCTHQSTAVSLSFGRGFWFFSTVHDCFGCIYLCATIRSGRRHWISWEWSYQQLWGIIWMLGIKPRCSGRADSALNCGAISPAFSSFFFLFLFSFLSFSFSFPLSLPSSLFFTHLQHLHSTSSAS